MRVLLAVMAVAVAVAVGRADTRMDYGGEGDLLYVPMAQANPAFRLALDHIRAERFDRAVPLLKVFVRSNPDNADGWSLLGFSLRKTGATDGALEGYTRALELDPQHLRATEYLGELYLQIHDLEAALKQLDMLTVLCPEGCTERTVLEQEIDAYVTSRPAAGG